MKKHTIYLDSPASEWELGTPIGNGFSGAMLYGRTDREIIQLTEEAIWSGGTTDTTEPDFYEKFIHARQLFLDGKPAEGDEYAKTVLEYAHHRIGSQETAGELLLDFGPSESIENYRRELDLMNAVASISYLRDGEAILRESFASYPDRAICTRITGRHSFTLSYERKRSRNQVDSQTHVSNVISDNDPRFNIDSVVISKDTMTVKGRPTVGGRPFEVKLRVITDGRLLIEGETLVISGAAKTELICSLAVGRAAELPTAGYDELRERHIADFSAIMRRSELKLGGEEVPETSADKRLDSFKDADAAFDAGLVELYFDFGKYLLISSSREGSLPANLQGVWNPYTAAPWCSDYHVNINTQMNYWHAESANLADCASPLFDYMNSCLLESGRHTAEVNYHCRGTVTHHVSDIYGFTTPADAAQFGLWQIGGAWLCYSMWEHYLYSGDKDFLRNTAYEFIHDSARFFLDFMFEDENGRLLSGPSPSPENQYFHEGKRLHLSLSPTMDIEVIGGLLGFYIEMESLLGLDPAQAKEAETALGKLPPLKIGKHGQLMEWLEDYDEPEPGHRHISHLFALYPGCAITKATPELIGAARRSLERRLANGGGHTGWSCAWLIGVYARLGDPVGAVNMIRKLFSQSTLGSLLDSHPPFQIDGNFGGTAAIIEMLMQSHDGCVELLPACPKELGTGSFKGFRARGGLTVSASWRELELQSFELESERGGEFKVCCAGREWTLTLAPGERRLVTM